MKKVKISINRIIVELDNCILNETYVVNILDDIFEKMSDNIEERIIEITEYLGIIEPCSELSKENILYLFRGYFSKWLLNRAVEMALCKNGCHDILEYIKILITEENMKNAIYGEIMINAFSDAIRSIKKESGLDACLLGGKIILLEKKYLGK